MNKVMKQQTAVDYLFEQLWETPKNRFEWYAILSRAKEMEKEQIIAAHTRAYLIPEDTISIEIANERSEQYYNETYNK